MKTLKLLVAFLFLTSFIAKAQTYEVTFQVDVSNEDLNGNDVYLAGTFNDWCDNCLTMTALGNGQYTQTMTLQAGIHHYKFIIGSWETNPESFVGGESCTVTTDETNRVTPSIDSDTTLDMVCFNSCDACEIDDPDAGCTNPDAENYNELALEDGDQVYVAGDFNEWCGNCTELLDDNSDNIYTGTGVLPEGMNEFKYTINGWDGTVELFDGSESCVVQNGDNYNRQIEIQSYYTTSAYCFNECEECGIQIPILIVFQVEMSNEMVSDDGVYIVGDFNDWNETATQLTEIGSGIYQAAVFMNVNESVDYKFLNGPDYAFEETVPQECGVDNGFGGFNRTYTAGNTTETLAPVCFSGCSACVVIPMVDLTFNLDLGPEEASTDGVHVAGSFNNFDPTASTMINIGDNFYELTVQVPENSAITYKFINGIDFNQSEIVPFECGIDDGFGAYNRNYNTSSVDAVLDVVCFSSCQECIVENIGEEKIELLLYPNPISTGERLNVSENIQLIKATLMNSLGQEVQLTINEGIVIPELPSGMYSIAVEYNGGQLISRILIE
ncbi:MAG: T9SS type A sorting domain-containing protein [Flavobacteriales bacterium]